MKIQSGRIRKGVQTRGASPTTTIGEVNREGGGTSALFRQGRGKSTGGKISVVARDAGKKARRRLKQQQGRGQAAKQVSRVRRKILLVQKRDDVLQENQASSITTRAKEDRVTGLQKKKRTVNNQGVVNTGEILRKKSTKSGIQYGKGGTRCNSMKNMGVQWSRSEIKKGGEPGTHPRGKVEISDR